MAAPTSFSKKVKANIRQIPGAKPSIYNNQLLVSTGISSLDAVLGGGVAVGTVLLIEEDAGAKYAEVMTRYFLAEGIVSSHALYVVSASEDPQRMLERLPAPVDEVCDITGEQTPSQDSGDAKEKMTIAWRYQNQPRLKLTSQNQFGHYFNLSKTMEGERLRAADVDCTGFSDLLTYESDHIDRMKKTTYCRYHCVLQKIRSRIKEGDFATSANIEKRNILRIVIQGLGSSLWGETGQEEDASLSQFLLALRAQLRTAFSICLITMPTHLFQSTAVVKRAQQLCDTVLRLHSFSAAHKAKNPTLRDYSGLLHVVKLPCLNQWQPHMPETLDLAFRCQRKKFTVEKLHLPPEFSDTASREQDETLPSLCTSLACSSISGGSSLLHF